MNPRKLLALPLLASIGGLTISSQAGAGVRWDQPQPLTLPAVCASNHAVASSDLVISEARDIVDWTVSARPECVGATVTLAAHKTAYDHWVDGESQPLIGSNSMVLTGEAQTFRLRVSCGYQVDAVVGPALEVVDGSHRYNEFGIGGTVNRLVDVVYTGTDCPAPTTTEAPPEITTTTAPFTEQTTVPTPPVVTFETTPLPSTTLPEVVAEVPTPATDTTWAGTAGNPGPVLPFTAGKHTEGSLKLAAALGLIGALLMTPAAVTKVRRRG